MQIYTIVSDAGFAPKACPKQIIALKLNKNGFYEPRIESADQCIKCSICVEVCAFAADSQVIDLKPTSYAAWSLNDDIRKNSSSGGIAFEIGRQMLQQGFKICVVRYNYAKQIPEHYIARNEEELAASAGSKYLQSDTTDGFAGIDIHDKYVVTGTLVKSHLSDATSGVSGLNRISSSWISFAMEFRRCCYGKNTCARSAKTQNSRTSNGEANGGAGTTHGPWTTHIRHQTE